MSFQPIGDSALIWSSGSDKVQIRWRPSTLRVLSALFALCFAGIAVLVMLGTGAFDPIYAIIIGVHLYVYFRGAPHFNIGPDYLQRIRMSLYSGTWRGAIDYRIDTATLPGNSPTPVLRLVGVQESGDRRELVEVSEPHRESLEAVLKEIQKIQAAPQ